MANVFDQFDVAPAGPSAAPSGGVVLLHTSAGDAYYAPAPDNAAPLPEGTAAPVNGNGQSLQASGQGGNVFDQFDGPPVSTGGAALQGVQSGLSAGFNDEYSGLGSAGTQVRQAILPQAVNDAIDSPTGQAIAGVLSGTPLGTVGPALGLGGVLFDAATGNDNAIKAYQAGRDKVRAAQAAAQAQHPGAFLAGNIGGALATLPVAPELDALNGAGIVGRTLNAGLTGAAYGGLYGAGAGEGLPDTINQATNGAAIGGLGGAVAAPVMAGIGKAASAVAAPFKAAATPDKIAAQKVFAAIAADRPGTAPQDIANAIQRSNGVGEPMVVADFGRGAREGGRGVTHALARDAADSAHGSTLPAATGNRFQEQGARFHNDIMSIIGGNPEAVGRREAMQDAARYSNKANYAAAYREGAKPLWDEGFQQLTAAPAVQDAIKAASRTGANKAAADGFRPPQNPFEFAADGTMIAKEGVHPTLQFWDHVKRNLDDKISSLLRSGEKSAAADLQTLRKQLVDHLDELVPSYKGARSGAAAAFGEEDALTAGETFASSRMENEEARRAMAKATPAERQAFAYGFASDLLKKIREIPLKDRSTIASKAFLNSPAAKERIQIALGPDGARKLEARVRLETMMEATRAAVKDGSHTSKLLKQGGIIGGSGLSTGVAYGLVTGDHDWRDMTYVGILGSVIKSGHAGVSMRVAQRVSDLLATDNPKAVQEAVELVARDPRLMDVVRRADSLVSRAIAPTPPKLIGNVLPKMAGNADEEQPNGR